MPQPTLDRGLMGYPSGPSGTGRPNGGDTDRAPLRDDYRTPLLPGNYPPLGYSPGGAPRYTPADLTAPAQQAGTAQAGATQAESGGAYAGTATAQRPSDASPGDAPDRPYRDQPTPRRFLGVEPGVGVTVGAFLVVGVLVVALLVTAVRVLSPDDDYSDRIGSAPLTDDYEPTIPTAPQFSVPRNPGGTGVPRGVPTGQEVTYRVTLEGSGTILYVDDVGVRTEFSPPPTWTLEFTAGANPLRLLVVVGEGSSAHCAILVGGSEVASDDVAPQSTQRTATCVA